jgi:hypothetical protein
MRGKSRESIFHIFLFGGWFGSIIGTAIFGDFGDISLVNMMFAILSAIYTIINIRNDRFNKWMRKPLFKVLDGERNEVTYLDVTSPLRRPILPTPPAEDESISYDEEGRITARIKPWQWSQHIYDENGTTIHITIDVSKKADRLGFIHTAEIPLGVYRRYITVEYDIRDRLRNIHIEDSYNTEKNVKTWYTWKYYDSGKIKTYEDSNGNWWDGEHLSFRYPFDDTHKILHTYCLDF